MERREIYETKVIYFCFSSSGSAATVGGDAENSRMPQGDVVMIENESSLTNRTGQFHMNKKSEIYLTLVIDALLSQCVDKKGINTETRLNPGFRYFYCLTNNSSEFHSE